jgi:hypothetical protein
VKSSESDNTEGDGMECEDTEGDGVVTESHTPTRGSGSPSVKSPKINTQNTIQLITYQLNTLAKSLKCIAFIVMHR